MDESKKEIRLAGVIEESITDGPGVRFVVFTQGCPHHCPMCHNPQTHDFASGFMKGCDDIVSEMLENPLISGVTLSGGEPFAQAESSAYIARKAKENNKDVFTYTGYTFEELEKKAEKDKGVKDLIENSDYIVDGPFINSLKSLELRFRGSRNQRIIDVAKTLKQKKICIKEFD
jgi:anaerobic ribonucleoside-triphosphate reductase activating protein